MNSNKITMKKIILLLLIFCGSMLQAQNLVPNPSFEDTIHCPEGADQVSYSSGWSSYGNSPDYFNSCGATPTVNVPQNALGYQPAASGNAYCGFATYVSPPLIGPDDYREYLGRMLSANLITGTKYYVSFKVSLAYDGRLGPANCASNNLGVKFSNEPYNASYHVIYNPQINMNTIITDTLNWTRIFGSFISDSAYQYIIIGNFFDNSHTDTLILDGDSLCAGAYYYIDDICVSTDSLYCANYTYIGINEPGKPSSLNIYPNPATNYLNIDFSSFTSFYDLEVFDTFGRKLLTQKIHEQHKILNISNIPVGFLLIKISFNNQFLFYKFLKM